MNDGEILSRISSLVDEEHELLQMEAEGQLTDPHRERMHSLEVALDQCWDLLRQRRARRSAGLDPDGAQPRDAATVEHYQQ